MQHTPPSNTVLVVIPPPKIETQSTVVYVEWVSTNFTALNTHVLSAKKNCASGWHSWGRGWVQGVCRKEVGVGVGFWWSLDDFLRSLARAFDTSGEGGKTRKLEPKISKSTLKNG